MLSEGNTDRGLGKVVVDLGKVVLVVGLNETYRSVNDNVDDIYFDTMIVCSCWHIKSS